MADEQYKFMMESSLRKQIDTVFAAQGLTNREGMTRLIRFLLDRPTELHPLILRQLPGKSAEIITLAILEDVKNAVTPHPQEEEHSADPQARRGVVQGHGQGRKVVESKGN